MFHLQRCIKQIAGKEKPRHVLHHTLHKETKRQKLNDVVKRYLRL